MAFGSKRALGSQRQPAFDPAGAADEDEGGAPPPAGNEEEDLGGHGRCAED